MSILRNYSMLLLNIHGMPCCNNCRHCWALGSPDYPTIPLADIKFVLKSLAEFRDKNDVLAMPLFFKEPTIHPDFIEIVRSMKEHGFINEATFWATNGFGLARMNDDQWRSLKELGFDGLQFTFYGLEKTHDSFAGRSGAFRDIKTAIEKSNGHGVRWVAGHIVHQDNLAEIMANVTLVNALNPDPKNHRGWFLFSHQGRASTLARPTLAQMQQAELISKEGKWFRTEATHHREILENPAEAAQPYRQIGCNSLTFDLDPDMNAYCGGGCDSNGLLGLMPELKDDLKLGNLKQDSMCDLVNRYFDETPRPLKLLWDMTAGSLAEKYGDPSNDELFFKDDLVKNKWGTMALRELGR